MKTIIIIPVYNEIKNIGGVIEDLNKYFNSTDILIINDGSNDGIRKLFPILDINYIDIPINVGYALALHTGYLYAYKNKYDYLIQFDGDGQHIAKEALKLLKIAKESNADIIIGSRFKSPSGFKYTIPKRLVKFVFERLINKITNNKLTDPTSGLQVLNKKVIRHYAEMEEFPDYTDANLIITMLLNNFKVIEHNVSMKKRQKGISMHETIYGSMKYFIINLYSISVIVIKILINKIKIRSVKR